jgi:hypothetical protein
MIEIILSLASSPPNHDDFVVFPRTLLFLLIGLTALRYGEGRVSRAGHDLIVPKRAVRRRRRKNRVYRHKGRDQVPARHVSLVTRALISAVYHWRRAEVVGSALHD